MAGKLKISLTAWFGFMKARAPTQIMHVPLLAFSWSLEGTNHHACSPFELVLTDNFRLEVTVKELSLLLGLVVHRFRATNSESFLKCSRPSSYPVSMQ